MQRLSRSDRVTATNPTGRSQAPSEPIGRAGAGEGNAAEAGSGCEYVGLDFRNHLRGPQVGELCRTTNFEAQRLLAGDAEASGHDGSRDNEGPGEGIHMSRHRYRKVAVRDRGEHGGESNLGGGDDRR